MIGLSPTFNGTSSSPVGYTGLVEGELRVRLLGGLEVAGLEPHAIGSRKARTLLARLAVAAGHAVPVEEAIAAVWPGQPPPRAGEQLSVLVSRLRRVLGRDRIGRLDAGYLVRCDWLDTAVLEELTQEAARRLAAGHVGAAGAAAHAALALARGPLLPEELDAEWAAEPRRSCDLTLVRLRRLAAEAALLAGDAGSAVDAAVAALDADPYDEQVLRVLLAGCRAAGSVPVGLAEYDRFRRRLRDELGVDPEPATQQLHLDLLHTEPAPAARPVGAAPPGREAEMAALTDVVTRSRHAHRPLVVEVLGEAGIGKSRLLEAFVERMSDEGVVVVSGRCDELGRDLPLQPVVDALDAAVSALPREERNSVLGAEGALLDSLAGAVADRPEPGAGTSPQLVFRALTTLLRRMTGPAGGVLVLDDLHVADAATLAWLASLRAQPGSPLAVVVARRVEEPTALRTDTTVPVGPLSREAAAALVGSERVEELWERSRGHPLFLTELAHAPPGTMPTSVVAAVAARAERAGAACGSLRAAAVLGPLIDLDVLSSVTGRSLSSLLDDLEEGVRRRLLIESGASFRFPHALVREALASGASASRQAWLHRTAAEILAGRPDADPAVLAYHARSGGNRQRAAAALAAAAAIASRRWQHESALELLQEAAELHETPEVLRRRAAVLLQLNRYADAARDAGAAFAADPSAESYEVLAQTTYYHDHDFVRAAALADEAAARASDEVARLRCLALAGRALHSAGQLRLAEDRLTAVLDDPAGRAIPDVRVSLGMVRMHQGRAAEALALTETTDRSLDPLAFAPVVGTMMRGLAFAVAGRPLDALAEFDRCSRLMEERQITRYGGRPENCRGYLLRNLGAAAQAAEWNRLGLERGVALGQAEPQAHALLDLADAALERHDADAALELLAAAEAFEAVPHSHLWRHAMRRRLLAGRVSLATGDAVAAAEVAAALVDEATERRVDRYLVLARLLRECARYADAGAADRALVEADLARLAEVAGLDAWRTAADVAACFDVAAWRERAERQVQALALRAGEYGDGLRDYATRRTSMTSTRSRS